jgi:2-polyprenyl-3-methyl-5-hydroxy-6-metoxy-1,4-benzoquinol methylase
MITSVTMNIPCPLCNAMQVSEFASLPHNSEIFRIGQCQLCQFRYTLNPHEDTTSSGGDFSRAKRFHRRHHLIHNLLSKKLPAGSKIVEIGAGYGQLGSLLSHSFNYAGYEPSSERVGLALELHGVELKNEYFTDDSTADSSVDAIILDNVLEHLPTPRSILSNCYNKLVPGGLVVIVVPNYNDIRRFHSGWAQRNHLIRSHINYFTPKSLSQMLEAQSFTPKLMGPGLTNKRCIKSLPELIPHGLGLPLLGLYFYGIKHPQI